MANGYVSCIHSNDNVLRCLRSQIADKRLLSSWSIIIGLVVVVLASVAAWFFAPKGETQTYVTCPWTASLLIASRLFDLDT